MAAPRVLMRPHGEHKNLVIIEKTGWYADVEAWKKAVAGAKFDWDRKVYTATDEQAARISRHLSDLGLPVLMIHGVRERLEREVGQLTRQVEDAASFLAGLEEKLASEGKFLYPYQRQDILWMSTRRNLINCNDMGLGKSMEALCSLSPAEEMAVLAVCPNIAKGVWSREALKWRSDYRPEILTGRGSFRYPNVGELLIINYDVLPDDPPPIPEGLKGKLTLIGDEVHLLKAYKSKRSIRFAKLVALSARAIGLTGTPLPNTPNELWTILKLFDLAHEAFGSHKNFVEMFGGSKNPFGGFRWGKPKPEVGERLKPVLVRHTKAEVLDQLPPKTYQKIDIDVNAVTTATIDRELESVEGGKQRILRAKDLSEIAFGEFSRVRELLARLKIPAIEEIAELHEESGEPLIVFSAHRAPIDVLGKRKGWGAITGSTPAKLRTAIEEAFQRGELIGVAATIAAASTAITLTRAAHEYFVDRSWVPADNEQAEARGHRISQTRGVIVTDLVLNHVIDQHVHAVNARKQLTINESVERAREFKVLDIDVVREMLPSIPGSADLSKTMRGAREPNAEERSFMGGMLAVLGLCDGAVSRDGIGFTASDHRMCRDMCLDYLATGMLSHAQWRVMKTLAKKYRKQIERTIRA